MAGPGIGRFVPRVSNFEDEYGRTIESKYSIKVFQKSDTNNGAAWTKLKPGNLVKVSSGVPIETHEDNNRLVSDKLSSNGKFLPNGKHPFCTEKVTRSSTLIKNRKRVLENNCDGSSHIEDKLNDQKLSSYVPSIDQVRRNRKRKSEDKVEVKSKTKRRKEQLLDPLLDCNTDNSKNNLHDLHCHVSLKRAAKQTGICNTFQTSLKMGIDKCAKVEADERTLVGFAMPLCEDDNLGVNKKPKYVKSDLNSRLEKLDQNLNEIPVHSKEEHLKKLFKRKLSEAVGTKNTVSDQSHFSPFKVKLSAFEISLMKGKQNREWRNRTESATLRSSPRKRNSNMPRPSYCDKHHYKSGQSLDSALEQIEQNNKPLDEKGSMGQVNRSPISDSLCTLLSDENKCNRSQKRKLAKNSLKAKLLQNQNLKEIDLLKFHDEERRTDGCPFMYRMNGSPKLSKLPIKLSLDKLSGPANQIQGGMCSSIHKDLSSNSTPDSGTIQILDSSALNVHAKKSSFALRILTQAASSAAPISELPSSQMTAMFDFANNNSEPWPKRSENAAQHKKESVARAKCKNMLLEETVTMFRCTSFKAVHKPNEVKLSKAYLSPETSNSRSSRSSLISLTPRESQIKSEILSHNSTPSSLPSMISTNTEVVGAKVMIKRPVGVKKKCYLFSKGDEVLARWHDGLFYLAKILKIKEHHKCLVRFEDNSQYWSLYKDIHRVLKEEEIVCCLCLGDDSDPPNEIVLCEYCLQGYHQQCHSPSIGLGKLVDPDEPWFCRQCVFLHSVKVGGAVETGKWGEELRKMKCVLPYKLEDLNWDLQHKNNTDQSYCYCGGPGIWYQKMLQCCRCKQWFHEACMQCLEFSLLFADSFYIFVCAPCNMGNEYIKRLDIEWPDLIHLGLFNLAMLYKNKYFDLYTELLPWIEENWDKLQAKQYENLSLEEKEKQVQSALEANKTRFANGSEISKQCTLWGLRLRVAPPRIHITLPISGKVTNEVMNRLKIKGRRSKVFTPVESTSPIQHIQHSPLHIGARVRKRLDTVLAAEPTDNCSPSNIPNSPTKCTHKSKKNVPLLDQLIPPDDNYTGLLDQLIPPDDDYTGLFHPFKTDIELDLEKHELETKYKIWKRLEELHDESNKTDEDCFSHKYYSLLDDPPIVEKVEPVEARESSHGISLVPELKEKLEKVSRSKSVSKCENTSDLYKGKRRSTRKPCLHHAPPDVTNNVKEEITVKKVKTVTDNYLCAYNKAQGYMKGFFVIGKNAISDADVEYLIHWSQ